MILTPRPIPMHDSGKKSVPRHIFTNNDCYSLAKKNPKSFQIWFEEKNHEKELNKKLEEAAKFEQNRLAEERKCQEAINKAQIEEWLNKKKLKKSKKANDNEELSINRNDPENFKSWLKVKKEQEELKKKEDEIRFTSQILSSTMRKEAAEASYKEWKQNVGSKHAQIPKNGFQIFGPKPEPVVQEDWDNCMPSQQPSSRSLHCLHNSPLLYTINSFRSEAPEVPTLELASNNFIPWHRRGSNKNTSSAHKTFVVRAPSKVTAMSKKKPPFRA